MSLPERLGIAIGTTVLTAGALVGTTGPASAAEARAAAPGPVVVTPMGDGCGDGPLDPCGIVYNRTGHTLQMARRSADHRYCKNPSSLKNLPAGKNSNSYLGWKDTDCFRDKKHWVWTNGRPYPPGEWIRVWTSKWAY